MKFVRWTRYSAFSFFLYFLSNVYMPSTASLALVCCYSTVHSENIRNCSLVLHICPLCTSGTLAVCLDQVFAGRQVIGTYDDNPSPHLIVPHHFHQIRSGQVWKFSSSNDDPEISVYTSSALPSSSSKFPRLCRHWPASSAALQANSAAPAIVVLTQYYERVLSHQTPGMVHRHGILRDLCARRPSCCAVKKIWNALTGLRFGWWWDSTSSSTLPWCCYSIALLLLLYTTTKQVLYTLYYKWWSLFLNVFI